MLSVKQILQLLYGSYIVGIVTGHALRIKVHFGNQSKKSKLVLYNLLLTFNSCLTALTGLAFFAGL